MERCVSGRWVPTSSAVELEVVSVPDGCSSSSDLEPRLGSSWRCCRLVQPATKMPMTRKRCWTWSPRFGCVSLVACRFSSAFLQLGFGLCRSLDAILRGETTHKRNDTSRIGSLSTRSWRGKNTKTLVHELAYKS